MVNRGKSWRLQRSMDSSHHINMPLRAGKKMKKRKELDALVAHSAGKRACHGGGGVSGGGGPGCGNVGVGGGVHKRPAGGASSQDQLLSESTDDQDDYWSGGGSGKSVESGGGGGGGRGSSRGARAASRFLLRRRLCGSLLRACTAALVFACVVATVTVMWLFIDIREQITSLRSKLDEVAAGSQNVPDALQRCHSLSRDLQQNQTSLFKRLDSVVAQLNNFGTMLNSIETRLHEVEDKVKSAPELVNVPRKMEDLSANVASFGSQIRDFDATVSGLKNQNHQLQETSDILVQNITTIKKTISQLLNATQFQSSGKDNEDKEAMYTIINHLSQNISRVNDTLNSKFQWTIEDQRMDHKRVEQLQEMGQNVSARITTLEGECAKASTQASLVTQIGNFTKQLHGTETQLGELNTRIFQLQLQYSDFESNSSLLIGMVNDIHEEVNKLKSQSSADPRLRPERLYQEETPTT